MHTIDYEIPLSGPALRLAPAAAPQVDRREADVEEGRRGRDGAEPLSDLARRVCEGLRAGEFHPGFQGVYHVTTGVLTRVEAQPRWTHPSYGLLLPGIFLMPLEHPQVAHEMAMFMIDSVCRTLHACLHAGVPLCPVAITVPAQIVVLESFADDLVRIAHSHGVPASLLEIDVPDSADAARLLSLRTLTEGLRDAGVSLSLGEFGKATASLASLGALDVDTVTLTRELLAAVPRDPRATIVMSALLDLLQALDVRVVVSGVDTDAQLQWLAQWPEVLAHGACFSRSKRNVKRGMKHDLLSLL
jgi:EAL domain-containing protein (putative c-di-GMP-specific phosphodiesterase class I)